MLPVFQCLALCISQSGVCITFFFLHGKNIVLIFYVEILVLYILHVLVGQCYYFYTKEIESY